MLLWAIFYLFLNMCTLKVTSVCQYAFSVGSHTIQLYLRFVSLLMSLLECFVVIILVEYLAATLATWTYFNPGLGQLNNSFSPISLVFNTSCVLWTHVCTYINMVMKSVFLFYYASELIMRIWFYVFIKCKVVIGPYRAPCESKRSFSLRNLVWSTCRVKCCLSDNINIARL